MFQDMLKWAEAIEQRQDMPVTQITHGDGSPPETLMLSDVARMLRQGAAAIEGIEEFKKKAESPAAEQGEVEPAAEQAAEVGTDPSVEDLI